MRVLQMSMLFQKSLPARLKAQRPEGSLRKVSEVGFSGRRVSTGGTAPAVTLYSPCPCFCRQEGAICLEPGIQNLTWG